MKNTLRTVLLAAAGLASAFCSAPGLAADTTRRLDALLASLHDRGLFDGALVVGDDRRILWEKGVGDADAERRVAFTPDTPADGGSLAKTFTAALLLMLQREGRLTIDEPAQRLVPELPYADITLRHLLSHSSGLPIADYDYFDPFLARDEVRTTERLAAIVGGQRPPLAFAPGTAFEYSSFGFDLAALAAARAAGATYAQLMQERFFRPLGMTSAFVRPGRFAEFPGIRTRGYRRVNGRLEPHDVFDLEGFHGGSNIYFSARDLHRWNASFLGRPVLDPPALAEALRFARIGNAPSGLTLGSWYRDAEGSAFWYSGHLQGFHSEVFRDMRSRRSIVYVSNNTVEPWMQKSPIRAVRAILDGIDVPPIEEPALDDVHREERVSLVGPWEVGDAGGVRIEKAESGIRMLHHGVGYSMVQIHSRAFYVPGLDFVIGFARASAGGPLSRIYMSSNISEAWGVRATKARRRPVNGPDLPAEAAP